MAIAGIAERHRRIAVTKPGIAMAPSHGSHALARSPEARCSGDLGLSMVPGTLERNAVCGGT